MIYWFRDGRFVKPGIAAPKDDAVRQQEKPLETVRFAGGGGDEPPAIDPIIAGLLKPLPKSGEVWPEDERKLWLQLLEGSFKLIYRDHEVKMINLKETNEAAE